MAAEKKSLLEIIKGWLPIIIFAIASLVAYGRLQDKVDVSAQTISKLDEKVAKTAEQESATNAKLDMVISELREVNLALRGNQNKGSKIVVSK
jgi:hypothetical protein